MNTTNDKRLRMPVGDTRRALPLLAVLLLLLAGLLAWSPAPAARRATA